MKYFEYHNGDVGKDISVAPILVIEWVKEFLHLKMWFNLPRVRQNYNCYFIEAYINDWKFYLKSSLFYSCQWQQILICQKRWN